MAGKKAEPTVLGGSITPAPNGYLATILTTGGTFPSPSVVQDIWSNARRRRYPRAWNGVEPEGHLVIYWTADPMRLRCRHCGASLGDYRAYQARGEYGLVQDTTRKYHPRENFPPDQFKNSPLDRLAPARQRYQLTGKIGQASTTIAHFACVNGHETERNLRRLGKKLFETQPAKYELE